MDGIRIEQRQDGKVDVVVEGLDQAAGMAMVGRILGGSTSPRPAPRSSAKAPIARAGRKKAAKIRCRFCGKLIGPQGRVSHERQNHAAELAKEGRRKARKSA